MSSMKEDMKKENKVKKKGKQKVVIEGIEPLNFKKLFAFCDPSKEHFDDSSTLASTPSLNRPDLTPQCPPTTTITETTEKPRSLPAMEDGDGKGKASTHTETTTTPQNNTTTTTTTTRELQPELKATHHDFSKLRIRRGIEVAIFAVLVVWGTIVALHKLEGKVDFNVIVDSEFISSERKKLINIFHKRKDGGNDGGGVTSSPISISTKTKKSINEVIKEAEEETVADAPSTTTTTSPISISTKTKKSINEVIKEAEEETVADAPSTTTKTKTIEEKELDGVPEPNDLPNTLDINNKNVNEDVDSLDDEVVESETVGIDPEQVPKAEEESVYADIRSDL